MINTIDAALFTSMVKSGAALLDQNRQRVNDLNVFPVPDGDTGSNMCFTINAGVQELSKKAPATVAEASKRFASALLRGARGNSGVILSLLFRGFSKAMEGRETAGTYEVARALQEGVEAAYNAVMRPTEGTILTVSRISAAAAKEFSETNNDVIALFENMIAAGDVALAGTTEMNPVLKKAGVIDAGGEGYMLILKGMLAALNGQPYTASGAAADEPAKADFNVFSAEEITFAFDTVFIVRKTVKKSLDPLRAFLESIGDSLVIGEDDDAFKVHVHTNVPGEALNEAQKYGTLELAKIENMRTQYEDVAAGKTAQSVDDLDDDVAPAAPAAPEKTYGFVSVCSGDGLKSVFRDLGADAIVDGGQTMNPSTEDILRAVDSVPAETVFVFPNNKNIIMAAEQAVPLSEKNVVVIGTTTVPQGITALFNFDESLDADTLTETFNESRSTVHTALVTYAVRDSEFGGASIKEGEYLALLDGALIDNNSDINAILAKIADSFGELDPELVNIYYGEDVSEDDASVAAAIFGEKLPNAENMLVDGGQPVYMYMISAE